MAGRSGDWEPEDHTGIRDEEAWGGTGADPGGEKGRYRSFQHGFGGASGFRVAGKISASAGIFLLYLQKEGILRSQGCCGFVVPYGGGNSVFGGI